MSARSASPPRELEPSRKRVRVSQRAPQVVVVVKGVVQGGRPDEGPPATLPDLLVENANLRKEIARLKGEPTSPLPSFSTPVGIPLLCDETIPLLDTTLDLRHTTDDLSAIGIPLQRDPDPRSPPESGYLFAPSPRPPPCTSSQERKCPTAIPPNLVQLLPSPLLSQFLLDRALHLVGWMHVSVHAPTFERKHAAWQAERAAGGEGVVYLGLPWLALYFAFLSLGAFFVENGDTAAIAAGLPQDHFSASRQWFDAALATLEAADYLRTHSGRAVQAMHVILLLGNVFE
ncbi:hypothetical protein JCM11251_006800 [Rhodosporidiobolus azoricus]